MPPTTTPYGSWKSPITSDLIVDAPGKKNEPQFGSNGIYWLESRPQEGGRYSIMRRNLDGTFSDLLAAPFNARTRVHEYGGGSYLVAGGTVFFSNYADQRLYKLEDGAEPAAITPEGAFRYADATVDAKRNLLYCIREDHSGDDEAVNTLVMVQADGDPRGGTVLASGNDFYASPALSPDGSQLAWLTWHHPNMPWDGTEIWVADVAADGTLNNARQIAGGADESVFQPQWSPDGTLYYISDRTGWWNLYRYTDSKEDEALCQMEVEFGVPQWVFGRLTYAFVSAETIILTYSQNGLSHLATLDTKTLALTEIETPYSADMEYIRCNGTHVLMTAGSYTKGSAIVQYSLATGDFETVNAQTKSAIGDGYFSRPEPIEYPTENGLTAHAFYYPPQNKDCVAPTDERHPLLILSHGGPTSRTIATLNMKIQFWTSRGIGVVDVNYGGSTGYGRAYRQRLNGQWGIVDSADCINAALYLVDRGVADRDRLMIAGGSAGGYTTLCVLAFHDVVGAGASHFGVADLEALAKHTHKFESRYLDSMIGPYPERRDIYMERSPINYVDQLSAPMILFQGLEDLVVPPAQSESMFIAVRDKELPVAYLAFEGEQHGFRRAENIKRVLDAELYFYAKVFGFDLADEIEPVEIENM